MDPAVASASIAGLTALLVAVIGLLQRRQHGASARTVRRALTDREATEAYCYKLRRQLIARGIKPEPWPERLAYLALDDPDGELEPEGADRGG
jgi:hypothetical protein